MFFAIFRENPKRRKAKMKKLTLGLILFMSLLLVGIRTSYAHVGCYREAVYNSDGEYIGCITNYNGWAVDYSPLGMSADAGAKFCDNIAKLNLFNNIFED